MANLAQAITSPGDIVLSPNPSYPIMPLDLYAGGAVRTCRRMSITEARREFMATLKRGVEYSFRNRSQWY